MSWWFEQRHRVNEWMTFLRKLKHCCRDDDDDDDDDVDDFVRIMNSWPMNWLPGSHTVRSCCGVQCLFCLFGYDGLHPLVAILWWVSFLSTLDLIQVKRSSIPTLDPFIGLRRSFLFMCSRELQRVRAWLTSAQGVLSLVTFNLGEPYKEWDRAVHVVLLISRYWRQPQKGGSTI